ncbi:unnamed protein product [Moneuplotes crassus]|uniref:Uncharacterized protein n=3 Tax=Euplotes crassus TaxID=5936 RepID=A0AAD1X0Q7_EUPCR|nr:unnamed protein product [Moneuplotes crassus]
MQDKILTEAHEESTSSAKMSLDCLSSKAMFLKSLLKSKITLSQRLFRARRSLNKLALRSEKINFSFEEIEEFWEKLACCEKINILTLFSSELANYIHNTNTYFLCLDIVKSKDKKQNKNNLQEYEEAKKSEAEANLLRQNKGDECQVLNALEIFWNINSDNIDLLKQNWGCKCEKCQSSDGHRLEKSVVHSVDFHVYELKPNIQGDVLTIKPEFLNQILKFCKNVNENFFNEGEKDLSLFRNGPDLYTFLLSELKSVKPQTWKEFEIQLSKVVEYRVASMYFAQKKYELSQQFEKELEEEIEKEEQAKIDALQKQNAPKQNKKKRSKKNRKKKVQSQEEPKTAEAVDDAKTKPRKKKNKKSKKNKKQDTVASPRLENPQKDLHPVTVVENTKEDTSEVAQLKSTIIIQKYWKKYLHNKSVKQNSKIEGKGLKPKTSEFPFDFDENDFVIPDFKEISTCKRRESASLGRNSDSDTTVASGGVPDKLNQDSSESNLSETYNEQSRYASSKFKTSYEEEKYNPDRDVDHSIRGRTKQKVYVKFSGIDKTRKVSYDSDSSEESEDDDPVRQMLKSNILRLYEDNNKQLYDNAAQYKEMKENRRLRDQYYNLNWNYNNQNQYQNPAMNPDEFFHKMFSQMADMAQQQNALNYVQQVDPTSYNNYNQQYDEGYNPNNNAEYGDEYPPESHFG